MSNNSALLPPPLPPSLPPSPLPPPPSMPPPPPPPHYDQSLFDCSHTKMHWDSVPGNGWCDVHKLGYHTDNIDPCWDGGDCCAWSCELNCNNNTPCEYECGHWGSINPVHSDLSKVGYLCWDDRKPACMWGGYCYDIFASPATRPLYYAWTTTLWITVGILGWTGLVLLSNLLEGTKCRSARPQEATSNAASGVTYVVLWLLLSNTVGGSLRTRLKRGVCLAMVPLSVCAVCIISWALLMPGGAPPSPPLVPPEPRFESTIDPAFSFGRFSIQGTTAFTFIRLMWIVISAKATSRTRRRNDSGNVQPDRAAQIAQDAKKPVSLPLYTLAGSSFVIALLHLIGTAAPPSVAIAAERMPSSVFVLSSATVNSGLIGGCYLLVVLHVQLSRNRLKQPGPNLNWSPAALVLAIAFLLCWLSAAAGFTLAAGMIIVEGPSNRTSLGTEGRAGDTLNLFECATCLIPCIACVAVAGAAGAARTAERLRLGANDQVVMLHGAPAASSGEADGREGAGSAAVALCGLLDCLTVLSRTLRLEYSIAFGHPQAASSALFAHSQLASLSPSDPIAAAMVWLVAAAVDVLLLLPRLIVAAPMTIVTAVAAPLLLLCASRTGVDAQEGDPPSAKTEESAGGTTKGGTGGRAGGSSDPSAEHDASTARHTARGLPPASADGNGNARAAAVELVPVVVGTPVKAR